MNLRPLGDRLVVEPIKQKDRSLGGILLPDAAREKLMQGKVLAIGPGVRSKENGPRIAMDVSQGDTVLYVNYSGTEIKIENKKFHILNETDVLATVQ